jgi:hypothetical protein
VLSILDPAAVQPPAFGSFGEHERMELRFDDVIEERPDRVAPARVTGRANFFQRRLDPRLSPSANSTEP